MPLASIKNDTAASSNVELLTIAQKHLDQRGKVGGQLTQCRSEFRPLVDLHVAPPSVCAWQHACATHPDDHRQMDCRHQPVRQRHALRQRRLAG